MKRFSWMQRIERWFEAFSPSEVADMSEVSFVRPVVASLKVIFLIVALPVLMMGPFVGLVWASVMMVVCSPWLLYRMWWWYRQADRYKDVPTLATELYGLWAANEAARLGTPRVAWDALPWQSQNAWRLVARLAIRNVDGKGHDEAPRRAT